MKKVKIGIKMKFEFLESPFQPGHPVSPENFKGREKDVIKIIRRMNNVINGQHQNFFIVGKKGMGKTSFAKYIGNIVETHYQLMPIYINNDGSHSLNELIKQVIESLFNEFDKETWGEKIIKTFIDNVEELKIPGYGFKLKEKNNEMIQNVKENFPNFLINISKKIEKEDKNGIFLIIDDINGLSDDNEFTHWYKSFSETLDFNKAKIPIAITLVSYPENFDKLALINSSFTRIFEYVEIDRLNNDDIKVFFKDTFSKVSINEINQDGLNAMVYFSQGMPLIMQQIGDSVFWIAENNKLTESNAYEGIINAVDEIGSKQIRPILKSIRSENYESILLKLGMHKIKKFKKREFEKYLSPLEKKVFSDFLIRCKELGILESIGRENSGEYQFTNMLYYVYFMVQPLKRNRN
jgi:DNA replication protein DnaC